MEAIHDMEPLSPRALDADAAASIRKLILSGQLEAGHHLVETQLAEQLSISRGTVRAAFRQLHHEGLVEYRPNRGVFVAQPDPDDVWELSTLRATLEAMAARLAAERITEAGRQKFRILLAAMREVFLSGDRGRARELDFDFHRLIVDLSGHRRLRKSYASLESQTRLFLILSDVLHPGLDHMLPLHEPLAQAIAAGDAKTAEALALHHSETDGRALVEHMRRQQEAAATA